VFKCDEISTISKDSENTAINTEIEREIKAKVLVKGMQIKNEQDVADQTHYNKIFTKLLIENEWISEASEHKPEWKFLFKEENEFIYYYKQKVESEYELIDGKWTFVYKNRRPLLNLEFSNYNHMNRMCLIDRIDRIDRKYNISYDSYLYYQLKDQTGT